MSVKNAIGQPDPVSEALKMPFKPVDVEWRISRAGYTANGPYAMVLAYVTNRAIMKRLDDTFGVFGWRNEFKEAPGGGVMCGISIKNGTEWVTKWDGADNTQIEAVKGGLSGAMKRCAVQWGIGRYLYYLGDTFAETSPQKQQGWNKQFDKKKNESFWWKTPDLPKWALPTEDK